MTTLLVDGHNNFIRCYAAYPSTNNNGKHFGAVVGFLRSLRSFVQVCNASRVVIVFDGEGGSQRRRQLNKEYKSGRRPLRLNRMIEMGPDEERRSLAFQHRRLREYLSDLPVSVVELPNIEADDVIAFLCEHLDGDKVIASNDMDFCQLLNEHVKIFKPTKGVFFTAEDCLKQWSVAPCNMPLARAIVGDTSDNIVGVKGIGMKRAVKMFPQLAGEKVLTPVDLQTICTQNENAKTRVITEHLQCIADNYQLMRLTPPIISAFSITQIKSSIKEHPVLRNLELRKKLVRDEIDVGNNFHNTFMFLAYASKK